MTLPGRRGSRIATTEIVGWSPRTPLSRSPESRSALPECWPSAVRSCCRCRRRAEAPREHVFGFGAYHRGSAYSMKTRKTWSVFTSSFNRIVSQYWRKISTRDRTCWACPDLLTPPCLVEVSPMGYQPFSTSVRGSSPFRNTQFLMRSALRSGVPRSLSVSKISWALSWPERSIAIRMSRSCNVELSASTRSLPHCPEARSRPHLASR